MKTLKNIRDNSQPDQEASQELNQEEEQKIRGSAKRVTPYKACGSIPHLPGSTVSNSRDRYCQAGQAVICTETSRDAFDVVVVQEKLDGTTVAVVRQGDRLIPIQRHGYSAISSHDESLHQFHDWALENQARFLGVLKPGERLVGEWLLIAHGTRYRLRHEPFVAFDIIMGNANARRETARGVQERVAAFGFTTPRVVHCGGPISIASVVERLGSSGHGAVDPVEGAVWRVERHGKVDFLTKYVRSGHMHGKYRPEISGGLPVRNE